MFCKNCKVKLTAENRYKNVCLLLCRSCYRKYTRDEYHNNEHTRIKKMEAIIKYHKTDKGKKLLRTASNRMREKYPEKWEARRKLHEAVRKGEILKGNCIYMTTGECSGRIEAHHHMGYKGEHWKDIVWVCIKHHKELDRKS